MIEGRQRLLLYFTFPGLRWTQTRPNICEAPVAKWRDLQVEQAGDRFIVRLQNGATGQTLGEVVGQPGQSLLLPYIELRAQHPALPEACPYGDLLLLASALAAQDQPADSLRIAVHDCVRAHERLWAEKTS